MISEILATEGGRPRLVRVLLKFNQFQKKHPDFGIWSYLIDVGESVVVFEAGPKYAATRPILRQYSELTNNSKIIYLALKKYFPGKTVREIIFSHWHYDHCEAAPELQKLIYKKFGNTPPIRFHESDSGEKRLLGLMRGSVEEVYKKAGYKSWVFGSFVKDGEKIDGSDFYIMHFPGHTSGNLGLISYKHKIIVRSVLIKDLKGPLAKLALLIINEDMKNMKQSSSKVDMEGYSHYFLHPDIKVIELKRVDRLKERIEKIKQEKPIKKFRDNLSENQKIIFEGVRQKLPQIKVERKMDNSQKTINLEIKVPRIFNKK